MEAIVFNKQIKRIFILLICGLAISSANAQVTRGQVLRLFYKASTYYNKGEQDKAIETYREIATLAPRYPDTYLRMAEIYDKAQNYESAIVMYRKYINLEIDDAKIKEPSARLKVLEKQVGIEHYEDAEEKQAMELFAKYNVIPSAPKSSASEKSAEEKTSEQAKPATTVKNTSQENGGLALFSQYKDDEKKDPIVAQKSDDVEELKMAEDSNGEDEPEDLDFARPMQLSSGQQGLSLFNLSALVETRNEVLESDDNELDEAERLREDSIAKEQQRVNAYIASSMNEEINKANKKNSEILSSVATQGEIEEIVLDAAFLENVKKQVPTEIGTTSSNSSQVQSSDCDKPLLIYMKRDRLAQYGIRRPANVASSATVGQQDLATILEGRWVSSECNGNGHEIWMFDISKAGDNWLVALDDLSGAYLDDDDNLLEVSWSVIKNMWAADHEISTKLKELRAKTVTASLSNGIMSYSFVTEHQHKPRKTVYTWSRNILEGVTGFIPFGGVVSQVGNTLINYISEKDLQKTYTMTLDFYIKAMSANALKCEYVISEKERSSEGEKEIRKERKGCLLYKVDEGYKGFDFKYDGERNLLNKKLYTLVKEEAQVDANKLFPLAYMEYYGAGTKKSIAHAVGYMQQLAEKNDCQRAKAWLIPVCYNLSMDSEAYPLRIVRQKFRETADDLLGDLLLEKYPYAYSLQADIYASNGTNMDLISPSYKKAAELGDVYALYKLGMLYMEGQLEERDMEKSIAYLTEAAKKGYADAYLQLAILYRQGKLVERDYKKYIDYLFNAVNDGSVKALKELSDAYSLGLGVEQNFTVANHMKEQYMRASCNEWQEILNLYGYNTMF